MTLWDEYPGTQSILIPAEGIAHECITSFEEAKIWILISIGNAIAPVACNRIILVIPFLRGRNWFLRVSERSIFTNFCWFRWKKWVKNKFREPFVLINWKRLSDSNFEDQESNWFNVLKKNDFEYSISNDKELSSKKLVLISWSKELVFDAVKSCGKFINL